MQLKHYSLFFFYFRGAARSAGEMLGWKLWKFDFEN